MVHGVAGVGVGKDGVDTMNGCGAAKAKVGRAVEPDNAGDAEQRDCQRAEDRRVWQSASRRRA
jgi:hypothetical protein